jgi:lipopolysaccharide export system protein LptC
VAVELHLPDLPEVPISIGLGPAPASKRPPRRPQPWHLRARDSLSTYLPLLLMAVLALGTWWLVKNTPSAPEAVVATAVRHDADYKMSDFAIERFDASGKLRVRVEGAQLRHFPDTDRYEIDDARIRTLSTDGQVTLAVAERALANSDISEVKLIGGAQVSSTDASGRPLVMRSEFLHLFLTTERVVTNQPVRVSDGSNQLHAAGLEYDHRRRLLDLTGRLKAQLAPPPVRSKAAAAQAVGLTSP